MISMPMVCWTAMKTVSMGLPLPWCKVQPSSKPRLYGRWCKYSFSAKPGTYSVELTLPANFTNSSPTPPAVNLASVKSTTTSILVCTTLSPLAILFGMISMPTVYKTATKAVSMALLLPWYKVQLSSKPRLRLAVASTRSALSQGLTSYN